MMPHLSNIRDRTMQEIEADLEKFCDEGNIGAVMNLVDEMGEMEDRLFFFAQSGDLGKVKHYESLGCNLRQNDDALLKTAACGGQVDVMRYLIEKGADVHAEGDKAISLASAQGYLQSVQYLIAQGADVNVAIERGKDDVRDWAMAYKKAHDLHQHLSEALPQHEASTSKRKI